MMANGKLTYRINVKSKNELGQQRLTTMLWQTDIITY
ncbi:MAG: hypothetical protein ACLT33_01390 [Lachnospira pectinoschiza]